MSILSKLSEILNQKLYSTGWLDLLSHPRSLAYALEGRSKRLSNKYLSVASEVMDSRLLGLGIAIRHLDDESCEIYLPWGRRQEILAGASWLGVVITLSELAQRLIWERHVGRAVQVPRFFQCQADIDPEYKGPLSLRYQLSASERENLMVQMNVHGQIEGTGIVNLFTAQNKRVGSVSAVYRLSGDKVLPAPPSPD